MPRGLGLFDLGVIPVKAGVFGQDSRAGIGELFPLGALLVRGRAGSGRTQIATPLRLRVDDAHMLVTVGFLLAPGGQGLFFRLLRPLAATFGALKDVITRVVLAP